MATGNTTNAPAIRLEGIWKIFGDRASEAMRAIKESALSKAEVLEAYDCTVGMVDVNLEVRRGETFCIMGLSGCGKSTLVRHINRLIEPTAGSIEVLGQNILQLSQAALRDFRTRKTGMVFQHMALMPHRSVRDNVAFPLEVQGIPKIKRWEISQQALALVGLEGFEDHLPDQLSGGMQQRVGLARALASDPELLLLDEPFSALDPLIRRQLQTLFQELSRKLETTTVFITHDFDEAIRLGDRIAIMKDGRIIQVGTPREIVAAPKDDYIAEFVKDISRLKLVDASAIMQPIDRYRIPAGIDFSDLPRVQSETYLNDIINIASTTERPIVVTNGDGRDIGVVDRRALLVGIQGNN